MFESLGFLQIQNSKTLETFKIVDLRVPSGETHCVEQLTIRIHFWYKEIKLSNDVITEKFKKSSTVDLGYSEIFQIGNSTTFKRWELQSFSSSTCSSILNVDGFSIT